MAPDSTSGPGAIKRRMSPGLRRAHVRSAAERSLTNRSPLVLDRWSICSRLARPRRVASHADERAQRHLACAAIRSRDLFTARASISSLRAERRLLLFRHATDIVARGGLRMDACEPRARHRGFFLHSETTGEPETAELENPEDSSFASGLSKPAFPPSPREHGAKQRPLNHRHSCRRRTSRDQIRERDWQPSTGTLAPLIQLARADARNATTAPTSSGRPNRPNGSSLLTNSAMPADPPAGVSIP